MAIGTAFPAVLALAKEGDGDALARVYRDVSPIVLGCLRANRVPDPEDVAGDVFVSMVQSIGHFDGSEDQFRSWLLTIAHRRMVDELRAHTRAPADPTDPDDLPELAGTRPGTDVEAGDRLATRGILDAIDALTPDQRSVVMLRVLADLPVREIAAITGKPETAVKSLLHRGLARLHQLLEHHLVG